MESIIPWINDLKIKEVFKGENEEEGVGIIDFINGLVEMQWLKTEELQDVAQEAFALVEPWDEG